MLYQGCWRVAGSRLPIGTNVYDRDWDVLILLDGCRTDSMKELLSNQANHHTFGSLQSVGSSSREWMAKTFHPSRRDEVADTMYITANPYTNEILSPGGAERNFSPFNPQNWPSLNKSDFAHLEEVWKYGWVQKLGTVPPRRVTDRAISLSRSLDTKRLIIHYMQPHQPFLPIIQDNGAGNSNLQNDHDWAKKNCWQALYRGEISREIVKNAYLDNLSLVLNEVSLLLRNIDGKTTIISSDHGNAFGEWGIYGHPAGFLHPAVKTVPWVNTTATDFHRYSPPETETNSVDVTVEERLDRLGYL